MDYVARLQRNSQSYNLNVRLNISMYDLTEMVNHALILSQNRKIVNNSL